MTDNFLVYLQFQPFGPIVYIHEDNAVRDLFACIADLKETSPMTRRRSKSRVALWEEEDGKDDNGKNVEMGGKDKTSPAPKKGSVTSKGSPMKSSSPKATKRSSPKATTISSPKAMKVSSPKAMKVSSPKASPKRSSKKASNQKLMKTMKSAMKAPMKSSKGSQSRKSTDPKAMDYVSPVKTVEGS